MPRSVVVAVMRIVPVVVADYQRAAANSLDEGFAGCCSCRCSCCFCLYAITMCMQIRFAQKKKIDFICMWQPVVAIFLLLLLSLLLLLIGLPIFMYVFVYAHINGH